MNLLPWREKLFHKQKQWLLILICSTAIFLGVGVSWNYFIMQDKDQKIQQLKMDLTRQQQLSAQFSRERTNKSYHHLITPKVINTLEKNADGTLNLNFNNVLVRDLLKILGNYKNTNLLLSDAVAGNISVYMQKVSWRQALHAILAIKGLDFSIEDGILFIAPATEISILRQKSLSVAELATIFIPLHYAKAEDAILLLQNKSSDLLSERGRTAADARTNTLMIKDVSERITHIRQFLQTIDVPIKQVQISARIMSIDSNSAEELGLKFGTVKAEKSTDANHGSFLTQDSGHVTMAVARLADNTELDLELATLEREGHARMLSNPTLITINHQAASIESGEEIPYQEKTSSGATNIDFKKAVLRLKVSPEITPENKVLLNLVVNQDKVSTLTVNSVPAIDTQAIETQVLANNNQTIILGGIFEQSNSHTNERVPFLSAVPLVGNLFKNKEVHAEHRELLIFVRPKVLSYG